MHETSIVMDLLRVLGEQALQNKVSRITRVNLRIGRLRAVEPQQLRACFEIFAAGTPAAGAELAIEEIAVRGRCKACGREFDVPRYRFECPTCGGNDISVLAGRELYIHSFEADDEPLAGAGGP
jgi:hydrogenase nickel incorporation protein HypA/HybF